MLESILKKATLVDVIIILIASIAIVGFWRGVWNLLDHYLFTNDFLLSQLISIIGGVLLLALISRYK